MPSTLFAVMVGDKRTGDCTNTLKLFVSLEKAQEYGAAMRAKFPTDMSSVTIIETEVVY
jgi:hypothetical protein